MCHYRWDFWLTNLEENPFNYNNSQFIHFKKWLYKGQQKIWIFISDFLNYHQQSTDDLQAAVVMVVEVLIAAAWPLRDSLVVVHDTANVGAGSALAVVARVTRGTREVVVHAGVVAHLVSHDLKQGWCNYKFGRWWL